LANREKSRLYPPLDLDLLPAVIVPEKLCRMVDDGFLSRKPTAEGMAVGEIVGLRKHINFVLGQVSKHGQPSALGNHFDATNVANLFSLQPPR
jgi:hypothetical protein